MTGRRLTFIALDTVNKFRNSSGSKCEGLNLKGRDIDMMFVDENLQPCFTRLCLHTNYNRLHKEQRKVLGQHEI